MNIFIHFVTIYRGERGKVGLRGKASIPLIYCPGTPMVENCKQKDRSIHNLALVLIS